MNDVQVLDLLMSVVAAYGLGSSSLVQSVGVILARPEVRSDTIDSSQAGIYASFNRSHAILFVAT